jgi:hypothetical protein
MHARPVPATAQVPPLVEAAARTLRGRGEPLGRGDREAAERDHGASMSHVRVHDDALGRALARAVGAHAATVGGDVVRSGTAASRTHAVLGHELAHVAQQGGTPGQGPLVATHAGDAVEQDAGTRGGAHGG